MRRGLLLVLLLALTGCGLVPSLPFGGGGSGGGTSSADSLWPDVPALPGSQSLPADLPASVRLLVEGFVRSANIASPEDGVTRDYDFVMYEAAGSDTDLSTFYTDERMSQLGWTGVEGSCGGPEVAGLTGGLCGFSKRGEGGLDDYLLIVLLPGEGEGGRDQVAYLRFRGSPQS